MTTSTAFAIYTRDALRHPIPEDTGAYVEFEYPAQAGDRWRFRLLDLSRGGLAFELPATLPGLERGASLQPILLRCGERIVLGDFGVRHVSAELAASARCGGRFCPTTTAESRKLEELLDSLQSE